MSFLPKNRNRSFTEFYPFPKLQTPFFYHTHIKRIRWRDQNKDLFFKQILFYITLIFQTGYSCLFGKLIHAPFVFLKKADWLQAVRFLFFLFLHLIPTSFPFHFFLKKRKRGRRKVWKIRIISLIFLTGKRKEENESSLPLIPLYLLKIWMRKQQREKIACFISSYRFWERNKKRKSLMIIDRNSKKNR